MITCPISSNLCKKDSKQFYRLHKFPFFRSSHLRCSVRNGALGNFAKFTRKHLWESLFFDKVTCWGDCFWSFLCLLFKMSCLFHSNRKMRWKKGKYPDGTQTFTFLLEYHLFRVKDFKRNLTDSNLIRRCA